MKALALRWGNDARGKSERILNAALVASKDAMEQGMLAGAEAAAYSVRAEIDNALVRMSTSVRDARRIGMLNVAASCITLLAAAVALWVVLR